MFFFGFGFESILSTWLSQFFDKLIKECLIPANMYLFKVNNRNTRKRCEIYSKLTMKTAVRHH